MLPIIIHFLSLVRESRGGTRMWHGWYMSCSGPAHPEELPWELRTLMILMGAMTLWSESQERQFLPMSPCYCLLNTYLLKPCPCMEQNLHFKAVQKHLEKPFRAHLRLGSSLSTVANPKSHFQKKLGERSQHQTSHSLLLPRAEPSAGTSSLAPAGSAEVPLRQVPGQSLPCPWAQEDVWSPTTHQPSPHLCLSPSVLGDSSDSTGRGC